MFLLLNITVDCVDGLHATEDGLHATEDGLHATEACVTVFISKDTQIFVPFSLNPG
jgi:hypothetical protein